MNTFTCKVLIKVNGHHAHVTVDGLRNTIHVFKYNNRTCDFMVFDTSNSGQEDAGNYIMDPLPTHYYCVTFPGDDQHNPS
jgi:hypothetical protein